MRVKADAAIGCIRTKNLAPMLPVMLERSGQRSILKLCEESCILKISPNNKIPAIYDYDVSVSVFESAAILIYLAEKTGQFLPEQPIQRIKVLEWLSWQTGGSTAGYDHSPDVASPSSGRSEV